MSTFGHRGDIVGHGGHAHGRGYPTTSTGATGPPAGPAPTIGRTLGIDTPRGPDAGNITDIKAASSSLTVIRAQYTWAAAQPTSESQTLNTGGLANYFGTGLDPIILIMMPPSWARPQGSGIHHPPSSNTQFGTFCGKVATWAKANHPGWRQKYEIWNEPNNPNFWDGPVGTAGPVKYAGMMQAAYKAIKDVDGTALVATGGTAPAPGTPANPKGYDWLDAVLTAMEANTGWTKPASGWHAWAAFDRICHHPYAGWRDSNGAVHGALQNATFNAFGYDTPAMANVVHAKVGISPYMWGTEWGLHHSPHATTGQGWVTNVPSYFATQGWDPISVFSESEAYGWCRDALGAWWGAWPTGTNLPTWPTGGVRTEILCYFHLGPDTTTNDIHQGTDAFYDIDNVQKRVTGGGNDLWEAFTGWNP